MDNATLSTILFIAAGVVLVLYILRRRKRKLG
jgi:LPXTG-motif cell wall-anchored protein